MNTYILIARHLGKVSGEKIYSYNKLEYMASRGWRVLFISGKDEQDQVDPSIGYSFHYFPALVYGPECYSEREIERTVEGVASLVGDLKGDRCIIESDSFNRALWAELIAKHLGAKHLAFFLQETHNYNEAARKFLRFKYDRHELAGITDNTINQMLGDESIERRDDTRITAYCNNAIKECEDIFSDRLYKEAKYTFGSLGRLDKLCVPAIIKGFRAYAEERPDEQFNLVLIGGASGRKTDQQARNLLTGCRNIHLLITGYVYPIPASLIRRIDVFVSTAGSASATYRYHRPTVKVHPVTGVPVGIMGLDDLSGKTMYDAMEDATIPACIDRALQSRDQIEYTLNYYEDYYPKMYAEFDRQLAFADVVKEKEYYDENLLKHLQSSHIKGHSLHRVIGHLFGARGLNAFIALLKKIKGV